MTDQLTHAARDQQAVADGAPVAAAKPAPAVVAASHMKQWMYDPNHHHHALRGKSSFAGPADRNTNMKNSKTSRFLQWERNLFGINLGWTDNASPQTATRVTRWFFTRPFNDESPLKYGDVFALGYGIEPSYVMYGERSVGINLTWSVKPTFEWEILGGPRGTQIQSGDWVALYNRVAKECIIYFPRELGGQVGWPSSTTLLDKIKDAALKYLKDHWEEGVAYLLSL